MRQPLTICYFGIYKPTAPRDKSCLDGLRAEGVTVLECVDSSPSVSKFFGLIKKHRALTGQYDALMVGYLSGIAVPLARILSRKKIVFNALCSMYETYVLDRGAYAPGSIAAGAIWLADWLAFRMADVILVESKSQQEFIAKLFRVDPKKLGVTWTGADEEVFFPEQGIAKKQRFSVVFRGMFLPATGVPHVVEAAKLLRGEDIDFLMIGWGQEQARIEHMISDAKLGAGSGSSSGAGLSLELITHFLPAADLRRRILESHVVLGQFGDHPRMDRTIQHKTFEALALGMPYVTRDSVSNRELLTDGENCIFVPPANPQAIAAAILKLKADPALRDRLGKNARALYAQRLSSRALGRQLLAAFEAN